jgi:hypothetical protein
VIEEYIRDLQETLSYTAEELNHIRQLMARYALDAVLDSSVREEAENIIRN